MPWRYNGAAILILDLLYLDFLLHEKKINKSAKLFVWVSHGKSLSIMSATPILNYFRYHFRDSGDRPCGQEESQLQWHEDVGISLCSYMPQVN